MHHNNGFKLLQKKTTYDIATKENKYTNKIILVLQKKYNRRLISDFITFIIKICIINNINTYNQLLVYTTQIPPTCYLYLSKTKNTLQKIMQLYIYLFRKSFIYQELMIYLSNYASIQNTILNGTQLSTYHLLWKLKDFIAKAKMTAKITQKATTIIPAIPKKSCLYPKPSLSNCLTGTK